MTRAKDAAFLGLCGVLGWAMIVLGLSADPPPAQAVSPPPAFNSEWLARSVEAENRSAQAAAALETLRLVVDDARQRIAQLETERAQIEDRLRQIEDRRAVR